jgi:NAD(P)H-nitrite reductase large subunit
MRVCGLDGQTQRLETDLVVIAIGVRPEIALAEVRELKSAVRRDCC